MKAVFLSIRPNWCKLIWGGMKTVEVRKTRPKLETPFKVYIYCTGAGAWRQRSPKTGLQKMEERIIGTFVCDKIDQLTHIGATGSREPAKLYANCGENVAYCCSCGQAVDMEYYRRKANDSNLDT